MLEQGAHSEVHALNCIDGIADPSRIRRRKWNNDFFVLGMTAVPQAVESNKIGIDLRHIFTQGSGEPDADVVECQHHPLDIGNDPREGFTVDFLFDLPRVTIAHAHIPTAQIQVSQTSRRCAMRVTSTFFNSSSI